jgi:uncharacterized protein YjlB
MTPSQLYYFDDDGTIPNSHLPVIVYSKVFIGENMAMQMQAKFQENNWTNNWQDIILPYDHFHSNTHEVLGVANGTVSLQIGGKNGIQKTFVAGDVIILPAGVGHYSVSAHTDYLIVGGYPDGAAWDLLTGTPKEREIAIINIKSLLLPVLDPVFGSEGGMKEYWNF